MKNILVIDKDSPFYEVKKVKDDLVFEVESFIKAHVSGKKQVIDPLSDYSLEENSLIVTFDQFKEIVDLDGVNIEYAEHIGMGLVDMIYQRVYLPNKKNKHLIRNRRKKQ